MQPEHEHQPQAGVPGPEQPAAGEQLLDVQPLEAHIVVLRAQLAHHERTLELATAAVLVAAAVLLVAQYRGLRGVRA